MLSGGLIGFVIGVFFGLAGNSAWPDAIWRASVAALLGAVLLRWWGRVWINSLRAAQREQAEQPQMRANGHGVQTGGVPKTGL